ncbi:MAG: hypothetical protein AAFO91_03015 [Bacteroidota bacterium]
MRWAIGATIAVNMNVAMPSTQAVPLSNDAQMFEALFSEGNLLQLLVAIRGSSMPDETKMHMRDLVLEYSQLTEDDQKTIVQAQVIEGVAPYAEDFSFLRSESLPAVAPDQSRVPTDPAPKFTIEPIDTTNAATEPLATSEAPGVSTLAVSVPEPKTAVGRVRPRPAFGVSAPTAPVAVEDKVESTEPKSELEMTEPEREQSAATQPLSSAPTTETASGDTLKRIQEIKQSVNGKVGNPVNLIDADNTIGREYMNALLDALKKTAGGDQSGELQSAMERLEKAYQAVEVLIEEKGSDVIAAGAVPHSAPPAASSQAEPVSSSAPATASVEQSTPAPTADTSAVERKLHVQSLKVPQPAPDSDIDISTLQAAPTSPAAVPAAPVVEETKSSPLQSLTSRLLSRHQDETKPVESPVQTESASTPLTAPAVEKTATELDAEEDKKMLHEIHAVGKVETLPEKMSTLKKVFDKKAKEEKESLSDDVHVPTVTAGLDQLLSEWKLFKRSGFLGTGPNGSEHPLFIKLKDLPMAAVISGRFEGATSDIKQSITDYMNGWRYEQDVVHEMNEKFEHYLRRVVLSILKKQAESES